MIAWYEPKDSRPGIRRGSAVWFPKVHTIIEAEESSPEEFELGLESFHQMGQRSREEASQIHRLRPSVIHERLLLAVRAGFQKDV